MHWNSFAGERQRFPIRALARKLSSTGSCHLVVLSSAKGHVNSVGNVFPGDELFIARKRPEFATLAPKISMGFAEVSEQVPSLPAGLCN